MDTTSLIMGVVILVIIAIPVVILARGGKNKAEDGSEKK